MSRSLSAAFARPWIRKTAYTSAVTLQIACTAHLINEHVLEIRNSTGASMLPTLAPEGDFLLQLRLPFAAFLESFRHTTQDEDSEGYHPYRGRKSVGGSGFSKADRAQGTGLKVGDLVVALSPFDPSRAVCKRVIGLPGDTVALDVRMRPIPEHAWRGRTPTTAPSHANADEALGSKMVKFEDILKGAAVPEGGEVDLLKSMDTSSTSEPDTQTHNSAAVHALQGHTYVRSKGDVQYVTIPLGHVWLAGDNMGNSTDSRHYGPVPLGMVKGKVLARVYPNPRWLTNNLAFIDD